MRSEAGAKAVRRTEPMASDPEEDPDALARGDAREHPGGPHVGEQPDAGLRHREQRLLRGDADRAVDGKSDPAAHDDAIPQSDLKHGLALMQRRDLVIQSVLVVEKIGWRAVTLEHALAHLRDVATSAQRPALAGEEDTANGGSQPIVLFPQLRDHRQRQRIQLLGPAEREPRHGAARLKAHEGIRGLRPCGMPTRQRPLPRPQR
mmetsp:Transcript_118042/g.333875  ORF Transcript_118042/g.333875 Transcript_118042/m.333875 type:complete len:205 (-) Transcript_118042:126-740(-)